MKKVVHRSETRGLEQLGWFTNKYTFSNGCHQDAENQGFGALCFLNEEIIEGGMSLKAHPLANIEMICLPLAGSLAYCDSNGRHGVLYPDDVQIRSAGSGTSYTDYNYSKVDPVNFLQIGIRPLTQNRMPHAEQKTFPSRQRLNKLQIMASPEEKHGGLLIHQNAYVSMANLETGRELEYSVQRKGNGVYLFIIDGQITVEGETMRARDAIGLYDVKKVLLKSTRAAEILLMDIPMD